MRFEEALIELRKGKKIQSSRYEHIIFSLEDDFGYCLGVNDFIKDDWIVLEEPGKTFPEVFEAFKEGKGIRRKEWSKDAVMFNDGHEKSGIFYKDLLANDWEIL